MHASTRNSEPLLKQIRVITASIAIFENIFSPHESEEKGNGCNVL